MTTIAIPAQLVTRNFSNPPQLLTCSCSFNNTITAATKTLTTYSMTKTNLSTQFPGDSM
ncbi:unnamed protein product [Brassica rapa]|uniref:Uncharacterized protein n=1 Tax=Brassica campestris TaxID=3711 RepID=A0A8D9GHR5_BRACM|nr:unnamed protein product [Brassica rapa]